MSDSSLGSRALNWAPGKFEDLVRKLTTTTVTDGTNKLDLPNKWVPDSFDADRLLVEGDGTPALSVFKKTLSTPTGGVDPIAASLLNKYEAYRYPDYGLSDSAAGKFYSDVVGDKITSFKEQVPLSKARLLSAIQNQTLLAGVPGRTMGGMSVAKFLGHALQAGLLGGVALSIPYAIKRKKQHDALAKELKEDPIKEASIVKQAVPKDWTISFPGAGSAGTGVEGAVKALKGLIAQQTALAYYGRSGETPSIVPWKSYSAWVPAIGLGGLLAAGSMANKGALNVIDKVSDKTMEKHEKDQRRRITQLLTADKVTKEAAFANPITGALGAIWLALAPAFYGLGKRIGGATTDADKDAKLEKAFDKARREQNRSLIYTIGDELSVDPGNYLGQTRVTIPVREKKDKRKEAPSSLF